MALTPKIAMVFAAGLGTRMHPITQHTPKPMVKVAGKPLLDYRLDMLAAAGVQRVVVNTFHLPEQIEQHLGQRADMEIIVSRETIRLETGGGLVQARKFLGNDPIFIMNSDVIWRDAPGAAPALQQLADAWQPGLQALLLLARMDHAIGYHGGGDFNLAADGRTLLKPEATPRSHIFSGVQIFDPTVLDHLPQALPGNAFSLSEIFRAANHEGTLRGIAGVEYNGRWLHVDSPETLAEAEAELLHS